jgi:hypothetical protein
MNFMAVPCFLFERLRVGQSWLFPTLVEVLSPCYASEEQFIYSVSNIPFLISLETRLPKRHFVKC